MCQEFITRQETQDVKVYIVNTDISTDKEEHLVAIYMRKWYWRRCIPEWQRYIEIWFSFNYARVILTKNGMHHTTPPDFDLNTEYRLGNVVKGIYSATEAS